MFSMIFCLIKMVLQSLVFYMIFYINNIILSSTLSPLLLFDVRKQIFKSFCLRRMSIFPLSESNNKNLGRDLLREEGAWVKISKFYVLTYIHSFSSYLNTTNWKNFNRNGVITGFRQICLSFCWSSSAGWTKETMQWVQYKWALIKLK